MSAQDLFKKIIILDKDTEEILVENALANLVDGKYQLGQANASKSVNIKFVLKDDVDAIPSKLFAGTDMTDITLPEVITSVASDAFEGLTLPAETIAALEEKLPEGEELSDVKEKTEEQQEEPQPQPTYTVTFKDGEIVIGKPITGVTGTPIEAPADPEKEGYEFKGWSIDGENAVEEVISAIGNANVTYTALWTEVQQEEPEFTPKTVYFISYNDNEGTTEYARGKVETTNISKDGKTKVKVLTNTIEGWVNEEFYVDSNAKEDDNNFYQLFKLENDALTAINVWVKLFLTEPKQEEPVEPEEPEKEYYLGSATEEQIQDQEYINSLILNKSGKPESFEVNKGFNILITPDEWGNPEIYGDAEYNFGVSPYDIDELEIVNPDGYIVSVVETGEDSTFFIKQWN